MHLITRTTKPDHTRAGSDFSWTRALGSLDGRHQVTDSAALRFAQQLRNDYNGLQPEGCYAPFSSLLPTRAFNVPARAGRAQTAGHFTQGGALTTNEVIGLADALRPASFVVAAGAQVLPVSGNCGFPRFSNVITGSWLAEGETCPTVDATVAELNLSPRRVACNVTISRQLLAQTGGGIEDHIRKEMRAAIGQALDGAVCAGAGGREPLGIINHPGVNTVTFGGAATWEQILNMELEVAADDAEAASALYVADPATRRKLKAKERAPGSGFIWDRREVNGYGAHCTTFLSATHQVIFGDFSEVVIPHWGGGIYFLVNPYTGAKEGLLSIYAELLMDAGIRRSQAFCTSTDAGNA